MTDDPNAIHTARLKRMRFRAWRRGIREADLILGPFADLEMLNLRPEELDDFEALLEQPDTMLYSWIIGREAPPPAVDTPVFRRICAFAPTAHRYIAPGG